ncbi:hypothetical protein G9A89_019679 [Geosiphon pyriformis]|nr:hypothetical protein G9A89_019679 [Geosiphon pyriformis]
MSNSWERVDIYYNYCEETYSVQSQYSIDFESETKTSNKGKQKLKQYSKTTPNTPILPKTTAKYLQTPEQETKDFTSLQSLTKQQEPFQTSSNLLDFLAENQSEHSKTAANKENDFEISEKKLIDSENKEDEMTAYIAKISEFNKKDIETSPQEWLDQVTKVGDANGWNAVRMLRTIPYFLKETAGKWFENLTTLFNDWTAFKTAFLEQFTNNNTLITLQNCFCNIKQEPSESVMTYIGKFNKLLRQIHQLETNDYYSNAQILDQFIAGLKDKLIKKIYPHAPEDLNSAIQHAKRYEMAIEEANCTKLVNLAIKETSSAAEKKTDQLTKKDFHHTALSESRAAAQQQNPSYTPTTISPARIAENANLSDIFPFEFEANELPFLLSNAAANKQKAITAIYTEAEVKGKAIRLILDNGSARSIITYQLMQQLKRNTVIITADGIKKTPIGEINNFPFTLNRITILVKVLVMDMPQYQALTGKPKNYNSLIKDNMCEYLLLVKASVFEFEEEEEKPVVKTFMALESTSNWAEETEQTYFATNSYPKEPETPGWNILYSKPEPKKQHPYIPLKYKDCHKKLFSMRACISPEEEYGKKIKRETLFNTTYNSALNKLYHYPHNAEMIYKLAMILIDGGTKEDVFQMKEAEYIKYTLKLAGFDYEDEVEVYYQIASHTYLTKEAQTQWLEQMNIKLCEECIMPCNEQWCSECYTLNIPLPSKSDEYEIEFGEPETTEEIETTLIYLIKNQSALQLKYFNNNEQKIKPEKVHEIKLNMI